METNELQKAENLILDILKQEKAPPDIDQCFKKLENEIPESIFRQALWRLIDDDKIYSSPGGQVLLKTAPLQ